MKGLKLLGLVAFVIQLNAQSVGSVGSDVITCIPDYAKALSPGNIHIVSSRIIQAIYHNQTPCSIAALFESACGTRELRIRWSMPFTDLTVSNSPPGQPDTRRNSLHRSISV